MVRQVGEYKVCFLQMGVHKDKWSFLVPQIGVYKVTQLLNNSQPITQVLCSTYNHSPVHAAEPMG